MGTQGGLLGGLSVAQRKSSGVDRCEGCQEATNWATKRAWGEQRGISQTGRKYHHCSRVMSTKGQCWESSNTPSFFIRLSWAPVTKQVVSQVLGTKQGTRLTADGQTAPGADMDATL